MKKVIVVLFTLFVGWTAVWAINFPVHTPVESALVYEVPETYQHVDFSASRSYQPSIDGDGYTMTPSGVSSGPRRAAGIGEVCPSRRDHGYHEFGDDGTCKYCHQTHNHYDGNGDKCCDICGQTLGSGAGTPGSDATQMIPVGSAVLPLLLMLMGYVLLLHRRRKQEVCE